VDTGGQTTPRKQDLASVARDIIDSNAYMTLATADENGCPWASPVWYAAEGYEHFYWVSSPEARHSRNVAARPEVGIVIFDSRAPIGTGQGVYVSAIAEELAGTELDRGIGVYLLSQISGTWSGRVDTGGRNAAGPPPLVPRDRIRALCTGR
jgi:uncharacterized protein YhbP (UPF0306 family)